MSGCSDLRKRWDNLVGKSEKEAVRTIKQDGKKSFNINKMKIIISEK